jgi:hypothetical protein
MSTEKKDPWDGDYVGNIFGWKISIIGGVLILLLVILAAGRHYYLDVPTGFDDPLAPKEIENTVQDSTTLVD